MDHKIFYRGFLLALCAKGYLYFPDINWHFNRAFKSMLKLVTQTIPDYSLEAQEMLEDYDLVFGVPQTVDKMVIEGIYSYIFEPYSSRCFKKFKLSAKEAKEELEKLYEFEIFIKLVEHFENELYRCNRSELERNKLLAERHDLVFYIDSGSIYFNNETSRKATEEEIKLWSMIRF